MNKGQYNYEYAIIAKLKVLCLFNYWNIHSYIYRLKLNDLRENKFMKNFFNFAVKQHLILWLF